MFIIAAFSRIRASYGCEELQNGLCYFDSFRDAMVDDIKLTNVEGIVHLDITKYKSCKYSEPWGEEIAGKEIDHHTSIEVELESGIVRTDDDRPWKATPKSFYIHLAPVSRLSETGGSYPWDGPSQAPSPLVPDDPLPTNVVETRGLVFVLPDYDPVYGAPHAFYNAKRDRMNFLYWTEGPNPGVRFCVCTIEHSPSCETSQVGDDHMNHDEVDYYEAGQLLRISTGLGCDPHRYYAIGEGAALAPVDAVTNTYRHPYVFDPRRGMVHAVSYMTNRGKGRFLPVLIQSEKVWETAESAVAGRTKKRVVVRRHVLRKL